MLIACENCKSIVDAEKIAQVEEADEVTGLSLSYQIVFLQCPVCLRALLGLKSEYQEKNINGANTLPRLYPPERVIYDLPEDISKIFQEAVICLRHNCSSAAALMCRKAIEVMCRHHIGDFRNLSDGIQKLHEERIIDSRLLEWAQALRLDGNLAAHEAEPIGNLSASYLVDFTEAILNYVFVLNKRFEDYLDFKKHGW